MKNYPFVCPNCFVNTTIDVETHNTSDTMPITVQCPICKRHVKVNGSIAVLPEGKPFKIDQRYII